MEASLLLVPVLKDVLIHLTQNSHFWLAFSLKRSSKIKNKKSFAVVICNTA